MRLPDGRYCSVGLAEFVSRARGLEPIRQGEDPGLVLAGLSASERELVARRAAHVREVLTGYVSGHAHMAAAGEPRPEFAEAWP